MVLPPIDESISDKIMLLKAFKRPMPMPTGTGKEREVFWKVLCSELPAFLDHLLKWEIPAALKDDRFGIKEFHHPDLLEALTKMQPETQLLSIIDQDILASQESWRGTSEALEKRLTGENASFARKAAKMFYFTSACGTFLGRLARIHPDRVTSTKSKNITTWHIVRAEQHQNED